ncbi:hypothetical protein [Candidatus Cyanaurora vandensis]|uniref:hypothetical protein n=1 Tax=Candidatus Cyanaurora vandensis TaxID=2714958 RepID=UPI00257C31B8|nr:hypothetical protein [Candidatus Cyanaurora vandensis]
MIARASALLLAGLMMVTMLPATAQSKQEANVKTNQKKKTNTGINKTLSPNLSCGPDEKNNNVTKGALYGAGTGLVLGGGLLGGAVGAGAGAVVQQEQNKDACNKG